MKIRTHIQKFIFLLVVCILWSNHSSFVFASGEDIFYVRPVLQNQQVRLGQKEIIQYELTNQTAEEVEVEVKYAPMKRDGLTLPYIKEELVEISEEIVTLLPHGNTQIQVSYSIPNDEEVAFYGELSFKTEGYTKAIPVLLDVKVPKDEKLSLEKVEMHSYLRNAKPVVVYEFDLHNTGKGHLFPQARVQLFSNDNQLKNITTKLTKNGEEGVDFLDFENNYILPGETKTFYALWDGEQVYGNIRMQYDITYGIYQKSRINGSKHFDLYKGARVAIAKYDVQAKEFHIDLENTGDIVVPIKGGLVVYANTTDQKVYETSLVKKSIQSISPHTHEVLSLPWNEFENLNSSKENQYHAIVTFVTDAENGSVETKKINLPYPGMEPKQETKNTYIIYGGGVIALICIIVFIVWKRSHPYTPRK